MAAIFLGGFIAPTPMNLNLIVQEDWTGHNHELQPRMLERYGPHKKRKLRRIGSHQAQAKSCTEGSVDGPFSTEQVHTSKNLERLYWSSRIWGF